jgi:HEPN domain-containing protein
LTVTEQARQWIDSAERDRDTVRILVGAPRQPYEIIAYHCQQCAEKYLKAMFIQFGRKPPFIHDLLQLNRGINDCNHPGFCAGDNFVPSRPLARR